MKNKLQVPVQLVLMLILLTGQHFAFLWLEGRMVDDAKQKAVISGEMAAYDERADAQWRDR